MLRTASVAMAVYNGERFLSQQIDSILAQLESEDELVISYDKSSDATLDLIRRYEANDSRVRVVENHNPGVVGNFNNAIANCTRDVVFISDQDDIWIEGKREIAVDTLNATGADLFIHNAVHINAEGEIISKPLFEEYGIRHGIVRNFAKPRYSGCCMAFPAKNKKFILPLPESVINYDHWIGMVSEVYGRIEFCDVVLLNHRIHGSNITTSTRPLPVVIRQRMNLLCELIKRRQVAMTIKD